MQLEVAAAATVAATATAAAAAATASSPSTAASTPAAASSTRDAVDAHDGLARASLVTDGAGVRVAARPRLKRGRVSDTKPKCVCECVSLCEIKHCFGVG